MDNKNQRHDKSDRPKVEWELATSFEDGDLVVSVKKLPVSRPKFSIEVGFKLQDKNVRYIPLKTDGQGKITVIEVSDRITKLIKQAEQYVLEVAQKREDEYIAYKISREERSMNRGKPETRKTGATERKKNKIRQKQAEA